MQTNAIRAALMFSVLADPRSALFDVQIDPELLGVFAAADNILFDVESATAEEEAEAVLGTREIWVAPLNAQGRALAADFILLARLRAGDTGPTPEPVTEDTTYDNGTVASNQTGVNNGSKTWEIDGSSDEPAISLLIDHCRVQGYGIPEKRGKQFAYIAFNEDRSSTYGTARVNTAFAPRDGAQRWSFNIPFVQVGFRRAAQNPLAGADGVPAAADISPNSGPVATPVTITGVNMDQVDAVRFGGAEVTVFTTQNPTTLTFAVPAGQAVGPKTVAMLYNTDDEAVAGTFEVTA